MDRKLQRFEGGVPAGPRKLSLALLPTPIEKADDVSAEFGVPVYVKRDDLTGLLLTGNKVRKLEFSLAEALDGGADTVITCGGVQSNHCRATAVACASLGLRSIVYLRGAASPPYTGNLLLDWLAGADIRFITSEEYAGREQLLREAAEAERRSGRKPYVIPEGASNAIGSFGYIDAVVEALVQAEALDIEIDAMVCAVGSGGTYAGLLAGAEVCEWPGTVYGVTVCDDAPAFEKRVDLVLDALESEFLPGLKTRAAAGRLVDGYKGRGYALSTPSELAQIAGMARKTGLLLDPVYTGKAWIGMTDLLRTGAIRERGGILFWHTGGLFGVFDKAAEFQAGNP